MEEASWRIELPSGCVDSVVEQGRDGRDGRVAMEERQSWDGECSGGEGLGEAGPGVYI